MKIRVRGQTMERVLLAIAALTMIGCSGAGEGETKTSDKLNIRHVRAMASNYSLYLADHRSQPPPDEQAFRRYLATKQESLEKSGLTIEEMFVSPRSGGPLVWVYGAVPPSGRLGAYLAYEQSPVDGKRLVIANLGMFEEVDEAQFRAVFPNVQ